MPDESADQPLVPRLKAVIEAKDEQIASLTGSLEAALAALNSEREHRRRQDLRIAELERRLSMDSDDSGTPSSKESIGAKAARKARQESQRERSKDRKRGGQPGRRGKGLKRDPDPDETRTAEPPAECRSCHGSLDGASPAEEKDGKAETAGAPHVLIVTTPDSRLRLMLALASRRKDSVGGGIPAAFTGTAVGRSSRRSSRAGSVTAVIPAASRRRCSARSIIASAATRTPSRTAPSTRADRRCMLYSVASTRCALTDAGSVFLN